MKSQGVHLNCRGLIKLGNDIWFSNLEFNGLFKLNLEDYKVNLAHEFNAPPDAMGLHSRQVFRHGDSLVFLPCLGDKIAIYDMHSDKEESISIPGFENKSFAAIYAEKRDHLIYMFSTYISNGVYVLDLANKCVSKDEKMSRMFDFISEDVTVNAHKYGDRVIFTLTGKNRFLELNEADGSFRWRGIPREDLNIHKVAFDGNHYWVLPMGTADVYEWDGKGGGFKRYRAIEAVDNEPSLVAYLQIVFDGGDVILLGANTKKILKVNREAGKLEDLFELPPNFRFVRNRLWDNWTWFDSYLIEDGKLWIFPSLGNMLLIYDMEADTVTGKEIMIPRQEIGYYAEEWERKMSSANMEKESEEIGTLERFINVAGCRTNNIRDKTSCGRLIYSEIKRYM